MSAPRVAIVDFGLGNLFSVRNACEHVGLQAGVTSERTDIVGADGLILPGVGAFGDAMRSLRALDLVGVLRDVAADGTPFVGICLGLQLLMEWSDESGGDEGLGIVTGQVLSLRDDLDDGSKVPHVGWNTIDPSTNDAGEWGQSLLSSVQPGAYMYFVHSYYVRPDDEKRVLATVRYGGHVFCAAVAQGNVTGFQFHPERSGPTGLTVYAALAKSFREGMA